MQRVLIIVLVLVAVLAFMVTYVVRFNESAVVTTFGKADASSVVTTPRLRFKLPYPFQKVTTYDTRVRIIESDKEEHKTADERVLVVSSFLTWRVKDPLEFYKRFGGESGSSQEHYRAAERILKAKLRTAAGAVSQYRSTDLVSASEQGSKLAELEAAMLKALKGEGDAALSGWGIEPVNVGIVGISLPQSVTTDVFTAMRSAREKLANAVIAEGTSEASKITSAAQANAQKIRDFADQLAQTIRSKGDVEATQYLSKMKEDPKLAVFLQNMDFMRKGFGSRTTLVLPTWMPGFELFRPDAGKKFGAGEPPGIDAEGALKKTSAQKEDAPEGRPAAQAQPSVAGGGK